MIKLLFVIAILIWWASFGKAMKRGRTTKAENKKLFRWLLRGHKIVNRKGWKK